MPERVMVIVPPSAPALYGYLKDKFAGDPTVSVILDRRASAEPRGTRAPAAERRQPSRPHAIVVTE